MAYTAVPTITTGDVATAAWGNTYIKNNFAAGVPDIITADSEVIIGTGANAVEVVAILDSNNRLKHEYGGLEFDASSVTTGDTVVGQSSGVIGLETAMTQGQAQAGTDTQVRGITALRMKEAITALGLANPMTANLNMAEYLVVGNGGSTGIAISSAGEVTMAAQPAVLAYNSATDSNVTGAGTQATVDFNTEVYDQNGDFASDTFTAPVTGRYLLMGNIELEGITAAGDSINCNFNGANRSFTQTYNTTNNLPNAFTAQLMIIMDMDADDTVICRAAVSGESSNVVDVTGAASANTSFSICLLA